MIISKIKYERPQLRTLGSVHSINLSQASPAIKIAMRALREAAEQNGGR